MSIDDMGISMEKYKNKFGEMPPIFGYPDNEILPAIKKALDTGVEMLGWNEVIEERLNIAKKDRGRAIIT